MGSQLPTLSRSELQDRFLRELESWDPTPPPPDERQLDLLHAHHEELRRWNPRLSLVGPGTAPQVVERHYVESWVGSALLDASDRHLVDVGTGAGFPGLVLAVARPDLRVTLVEPNGRKVAFLLTALRRMTGSITANTTGSMTGSTTPSMDTTRSASPSQQSAAAALSCTVVDARVDGSLPPPLDPSQTGFSRIPDVVTSRALAWTPAVRDPLLESFFDRSSRSSPDSIPDSFPDRFPDRPTHRSPRFLLWIGKDLPDLEGPITLRKTREVTRRDVPGSSQGHAEPVEHPVEHRIERRIVEITVSSDTAPTPSPTPRKEAP